MKTNRFGSLATMVAVGALLAACSNRVPTTALSNGYNSPLPTSAPVDQTNLFDTSGAGQSPVTPNLFDTTVTAAEQPATQTATTPATDTATNQCLSNGFDSYVYSTDPNANSSCVPPSQSGALYPVSEDTFYDLGVEMYSDMDSCLIAVLGKQPVDDASAQAAHQAGRRALIRCYRNIVRNMAGSLPWNYNQMSVYYQQDQNLAYLMYLLNQP